MIQEKIKELILLGEDCRTGNSETLILTPERMRYMKATSPENLVPLLKDTLRELDAKEKRSSGSLGISQTIR